MAIETQSAVQSRAVSVEIHEAMLLDKPAVVSRMMLRFFGGLARENPFLKPQIERIRRRALALNRLEWRALRAGVWKDFHQHTHADLHMKLDAWLSDPTALIENLDGRLTWIEGASEAQLAEETGHLPKGFFKLEEVADLASSKLRAKGQDLQDIRRALVSSFFELLACHAPEETERIAQVKARVLGMGPARAMAMKAATWQETKDLTLDQMAERLSHLFAHPADKLTEIEQRLSEAEALSSQEVEARAARIPAVILRLKDVLEAVQEPQPV